MGKKGRVRLNKLKKRIATLEKENAELKRQLEERRFQFHVPFECLKFEDSIEESRILNQSKENIAKSLSFIQRQFDERLMNCFFDR